MSGKSNWNRRLVTLGGGAAALGLAWAAFRRPERATGLKLPTGLPRTLRRGNGAEPSTLDPQLAVTIWEDWIMGDMFVGLMHQDAAGNPIPCAATGLTTSEDGLIHTVRLREHLWSDGVPVTAEDYVFAFRRIADPKLAAQYVSILYPIVNLQEAAEGRLPPEAIGVRALDPRTLEIRTRYQTPYIGQLLMHQTTYAVPRHVVEKHGAAWTKPENIAVNGPFILREWIPNDHVRLAKNPRFYDAAHVALDEIRFYPTEDSAAALKRFRAGELDLCNRCPAPPQIPEVRSEMPGVLRSSPFIATYFLVANHGRPPFNDPRVREALSLLIDREVLTEKVSRIGALPAYNLVPPGMPDYPYSARLGFQGLPMAQRQEKARALLAAAGFGPNRPLAFDFTTYNKIEWKLPAVALQAMWAEAGVRMRPLPLDSQIMYAMERSHDFDVCSTGWVADYRDPKNFLFLFQTSSTDLNYGLFSDARYDAMVEESDHVRDAAARLALMARAEQHLLDRMGMIPLYHDVTRNIVSPQVKGWIANPSDFNRSRWLSLDRSVQGL